MHIFLNLEQWLDYCKNLICKNDTRFIFPSFFLFFFSFFVCFFWGGALLHKKVHCNIHWEVFRNHFIRIQIYKNPELGKSITIKKKQQNKTKKHCEKYLPIVCVPSCDTCSKLPRDKKKYKIDRFHLKFQHFFVQNVLLVKRILKT